MEEQLTAIVAAKGIQLATLLSTASAQIEREQGKRYALNILAHASTFTQMLENISMLSPNVVIIDDTIVDKDNRSTFISNVHSLLYPTDNRRPVIFVACLRDMKLVEAYREMEITEVFEYPRTDGEAMIVIKNTVAAYEATERKIKSLGYTPVLTKDYVDNVEVMLTRSVIAVWSPKGGVGKTTIAINLASALAYYGRTQVMLVDSDMNCGDIHTTLSLDPARNIFGLATAYRANNNNLSLDMIARYRSVVPWLPSLHVLIGAYRSELGGRDVLVGEQGEQFARDLYYALNRNKDYKFIVVDVGQKIFEAMHLAWLVHADYVLVIGTSEKTTAQEIISSMSSIRESRTIDARNRFALVCNKWDDRHHLSRKDLINATGLLDYGMIPYDYSGDVTALSNLGKIFVIEMPDHPITEAIVSLAARFYPMVERNWSIKVNRGAPQKDEKTTRRFSLFGKR